MSAWQVVLPAEVVTKLVEHSVTLQQAAERAKGTSHEAAAYRDFKDYTDFTYLITALVKGQAAPEAHLRLAPLGARYSLVAVLTAHGWQAAFLIDRERRLCTLFEFTPASVAEQFKQRFRAPFP